MNASTELHVASLLIHVRQDRFADLVEWARHSGLELPACSPEGKAVALIETEDTAELLTWISRIESRPGVLSCSLVYHEQLPLETADSLVETATPGTCADGSRGEPTC